MYACIILYMFVWSVFLLVHNVHYILSYIQRLRNSIVYNNSQNNLVRIKKPWVLILSISIDHWYVYLLIPTIVTVAVWRFTSDLFDEEAGEECDEEHTQDMYGYM